MEVGGPVGACGGLEDAFTAIRIAEGKGPGVIGRAC